MSYRIIEEDITDNKEFETIKTIQFGLGRNYDIFHHEKPYLRITVEEHSTFTDAVLFGNYLYIGDYMNGIHIINLIDFTVRNIAIDWYFGRFQKEDDVIYVLGCCNIIAFDCCSQIIWKSDDISGDGITFHKIENHIMYVDCDIDPPGNWIERKINITNGKILI